MTKVWSLHSNGTGQEIAGLDTAQGNLTHLIDLEEYDAVLRLLFLGKEWEIVILLPLLTDIKRSLLKKNWYFSLPVKCTAPAGKYVCAGIILIAS